jgi:hypothetical protein
MMKKTHITRAEILRRISKKLNRYSELDYFGQFATFMGNVQLLEIGLKNLLASRYEYDETQVERWTLGRTTKELKEKGLRKDFVRLLNDLVEQRNYVAHELLANEIVYFALLRRGRPKAFYSKELRFLQKSIIHLEVVLFLFRWIERNNAWD